MAEIYRCALCRMRTKDWNGADPRCAFGPDGIFQADNCALMSALRDKAEELAEDEAAAALCNQDEWCFTLRLDWSIHGDNEAADFIVLAWYKYRGKCHGAWEINAGLEDEAVLTPLKEYTALLFLKQHGRTEPIEPPPAL